VVFPVNSQSVSAIIAVCSAVVSVYSRSSRTGRGNAALLGEDVESKLEVATRGVSSAFCTSVRLAKPSSMP
jgi:hypothetical protein